MNTNKHVAVFGSLTQDLFAYPKENSVITTETAQKTEKLYAMPYGGKVETEYIERHVGGGSANISVSFQRLGLQAYSFGATGDGVTGKWIVENLQKENVNIQNIQTIESCTSGFSIILNAFDGERTVIFTSEANKKFAEIKKNSLAETECDAIYLAHLSSTHSKEIYAEIELHLKANPTVIFAWNPGYESIERGIDQNTSLLKRCNFIFLNKEEAEKFTRTNSLHDTSHENRSNCFPMAEKLLQSGVGTVVITDGKNGAQVFTKTETIFTPTVSHERVDTLGAGDAFASTFISSILNGKDLQSSAKYASINAASVVSHRGAQDGLLSHEALYTDNR